MLARSKTPVHAASPHLLLETVDVLQACEEAVTACAAVVFTQPRPALMLAEVRRDLDCVDVLATTRRVLKRQGGGSGPEMLQAQAYACLIACQISYEFCSSHAEQHVEARRCSDATRMALVALDRLLRGSSKLSGVAVDGDRGVGGSQLFGDHLSV